MTIREVISGIEEHDEQLTLFAKRTGGKFKPTSEAVLIEVSEEDEHMPVAQTAEKYCPGYEYFMELFMIKELLEDLEGSEKYKSFDQKVEGVIYYEEFDCFEY